MKKTTENNGFFTSFFSGAKAGDRKRLLIVSAVVIALLTVIAFSSALNNEVTNWDDNEYLENPLIEELSPSNVGKIFTTFHKRTFSQPLVLLSFSIENALFNGSPTAYHTTNVALHMFNCVLLFYIIFLLCDKILVSFITSMLFAIHPLHVESVAWITERKDVMSTFFFLLSLLFYLFLRRVLRDCGEKWTRQVWKWYAASLIAFFLALLAKPSVVMLPLVMLLFDYLEGRNIKDFVRLIGEKIPFFALSLVFGLITIYIHRSTELTGQLNQVFLMDRVIIFCYSLVFYLVKTILPFNLSAIYPYPEKMSIFAPDFFVSVVVFLILAAVFLWFGLRRKTVVFGVLFFLITIFPMLKLVPFPTGGAIVADRYMYVPSIGIFYMIGIGFFKLYFSEGEKARARRVPLVIALIAVFALFTVMTNLRSEVWASSKTLWTDTIKKSPTAYLPHNNLGLILAREGKHKEAVELYKESLKFHPSYIPAHNNLGNAYKKLGMVDLAIKEYKFGNQGGSKYPQVHNNLGFTFFEQGKIDLAIAEYKEAIRIDPNFVDAYNNLGHAYYTRGRVDSAIKEYKKVLSIDPDYPEAHYNLGVAYNKKGKKDEAIKSYKEAVRLAPRHFEAHNNLGYVYLVSGRVKEALDSFKKVVSVNPDFASGRNNLGYTYLMIKRPEAAMREFKEALRLRPEYSNASYNLANTLFGLRRIDEAIVQYKDTIKFNPKHADAHNRLGVAYGSKGRFKQAVVEFKKAIKLRPGYAETHYNLAMTYFKLKQRTSAVKELRTVLKIKPDHEKAKKVLNSLKK